jgi:hypothetical protein
MTATTTLEHLPTADDSVEPDLVDAATATAARDQNAAAAAEAARREARGINVAFGALAVGLLISLFGFFTIAWHDSVAANGPHGGPAYAEKVASQSSTP